MATSCARLIGLGNPILRDDAIGIRLVRAVAARVGPRQGLEIVPEVSVGGLELLDVLVGCERAFLCDSIKTKPTRPGALHIFDAVALRETRNLRGIHDCNFATALALGRKLGMTLPEDEAIRIYGIEIEDGATFSETMSPSLERALPRLATLVAADLLSQTGIPKPTNRSSRASAAPPQAASPAAL